MATDESPTTSPDESASRGKGVARATAGEQAAQVVDGERTAAAAGDERVPRVSNSGRISRGASGEQAQGSADEEGAPPAAADGKAGQSADDGQKRTLPRWLRVAIAVVVVLALVVGGIAGAFAWDRWYRYDDAADFQGSWYPAGSTVAVEIGPDTIAFDDETAYTYTLDTHEKTVTYTLGPLQGQGHYWFADDRNTLVIEDGEGFTSDGTALVDFGRLLSGLDSAVDGKDVELPEGDGVSTFTRTPDPAAVAAKEEAARQAALEEQEKRKAEEEAARIEREAAEAAEAAAAEEAAREAGEEPQPQEFANESMGILE